MTNKNIKLYIEVSMSGKEGLRKAKRGLNATIPKAKDILVKVVRYYQSLTEILTVFQNQRLKKKPKKPSNSRKAEIFVAVKTASKIS